MSSSRDKSASKRTTRFETFESRIVFSVDSVIADLALQAEADLDQTNEAVQFSLSEAHESTGAEYVFNDYGFDGSGQTIAVIDSGIAWDHYALGGGYGENARVVGGWDFAENDDNPYDDGPAGYHGTHVAGIIGSEDIENRGVASGVDLVGLRVFDDAGGGNLDWVEQALQWVHDHKDDFTNPITTVNLSLGVDWNADNVPGWATLEDEFAQLEADNIFISVAAGNAFQSYNSTGLAYPAVSEHVVPVASHDADGNFSDFSQRNDRVLVAPGSSIRSTVPGHMFGSSQSTGFLGSSGTSMSAPYVAGASAVLRQAMEFSGYENISQDQLYDHFRETATQFYDSVTSGVYHRLDLGAAIDAIIEDAHGSSAANATQLGTINTGELIQGTIGKVTDVDAFSFTAGESGQMTISLAKTHDLNAIIKVDGQTVALDGNTAQFDVVVGRKYDFSISTSNGIGHYDLDMDLDARQTISSINLGTISDSVFGNQSVSGETWFSLTANQEGILSANIDQTNVSLAIYDSSMNLMTESGASGGNLRADTWVRNGEQYFVKITGSDSSFDLRLNNQVSVIDGLLRVNGTTGNDNITFDHNPDIGKVSVSVSNTQYQFSVDQVSRVFIHAGGGNDQLTLNLGGQGDQIHLVGDTAHVTASDFTLSTDSFDSISVHGDSTDQVNFLDTEGDDQFTTSGTQSSMTGNGFSNTANGITQVNAVSRGGHDTANIAGSQDHDHFTVTSQHAQLNNANGQVVAVGFKDVNVDGKGGDDTLVVHGSDAADQFTMTDQQTSAQLGGVHVESSNTELTIAVANDYNDSVVLNGTDGDDQLYSSESTTILTGNGYQNVALKTRQVVADVSDGAGNDTAWISDTSGDDTLVGNTDSTRMTGNGHDRHAIGFDSVTVVAENGGTDHAVFTGSTERDTMLSTGSTTYVWAASYHMGFIGFEDLQVDGNGGGDVVRMRGDNQNTSFQIASISTGVTAQMSGANYTVSASNFSTHRLDGRGGQNVVQLEGFDEDDSISAEGSALVAYLDGAQIRAENFVWLETETEEGHSSNREMSAVDFWYSMHGDWDDA